MSFTVEVTSVPDRDELVAEIWLGDQMIAEVQRAIDGRFQVQVYVNESEGVQAFDLQGWLDALVKAKEMLE